MKTKKEMIMIIMIGCFLSFGIWVMGTRIESEPFVFNNNVRAVTLVTLDTDNAITLSTTNCFGTIRINNDDDAIDYTLPAAQTGLVITFANALYAQIITVDSDAGDIIIMNDGTLLDAGNAIDSSGAKTDKGTLVALDDTYWILFSQQNTWVDGGAD